MKCKAHLRNHLLKSEYDETMSCYGNNISLIRNWHGHSDYHYPNYCYYYVARNY